MTVSTVSKNRIDIHLSAGELYEIFGGYEMIDYSEIICRAKIHRVIRDAIPDALLPLDCKKILIEVRPANAGCTISLIKLYDENNDTVLLIFENSEQLIAALPLLSRTVTKGSALFANGKNYALICTVTPLISKEYLHIYEYCKISYRETEKMRINEHWQLICKENAIEKLAHAFLK